MFISRVEIPWNAARNPYDIHRQIWRLFPGEARESRSTWEEERQGFLFRLEQGAPGRALRALVQSRFAPVAVGDISVLGTRSVDPRPSAGQRLAFLLTANPIKSIADSQRDAKPGKSSDRGVRVPLVDEDAQREWLSRKFEGVAETETLTILPHAPTYFRKGNQAGKLVTATFEGVLRVGDGERLRGLLAKGIGPAKSFGCGLLLVRRIG